MKIKRKKIKIGIVGCGAIGSRIAHSIKKELKDTCVVSGLFDINADRMRRLARDIKTTSAAKRSLSAMLNDCDLVVEAIASTHTPAVIRQILRAKKDILIMSVGKVLNAPGLFRLAKKNNCTMLLPSGAIAGIDAIKAAVTAGISSITLTTRKPISGFTQMPYLTKKGIRLKALTKETVLFDGGVDEAVKIFPRNINVAATLALASQAKKKLRIKITASPYFTSNSHEIIVAGAFGRITTRTENVPCPDNPKTSYLAVLSGIRTLQQFFEAIKIGT